jgi:hypothetical protein
MGAGNSLTGTIDVGTGNDTLDFASGNYTGVTFPTGNWGAGDTLNMTGTDFTFTGSQYTNLITNGFITQTGMVGDTIRISDASTVTFSNLNNAGVVQDGTFQTLVMQSSGADTVTFTSYDAVATPRFLDISAGGSDKLTLNNNLFEGGDSDSELVVTGFDVANDQIRLQEATVSNGTFQEITAAGSALVIGPLGVAEINTVVGTLIGAGGAQDVSDGGAVESLVAGAVGNAATGNYFFAMYASDGNAYLYEASTTAAGADVTTGNTAVELVGQLNGVAGNALALGNFFA